MYTLLFTGGGSSGSPIGLLGVTVYLCSVWDWHWVWWLQTMRLKLQNFFFTEQTSHLSFSPTLKPAHTEVMLPGLVCPCLSKVERWFHTVYGTIYSRLTTKAVETFCFMCVSWTNLLRQAATTTSFEIVDKYGPEPRRCTPGKIHQWHFYITWGYG